MCGWCSRGGESISRRNHSRPTAAAISGCEDLDRHRPVVLVVLGQVDRGHAAPAQRLDDLVRPEPGAGRQALTARPRTPAAPRPWPRRRREIRPRPRLCRRAGARPPGAARRRRSRCGRATRDATTARAQQIQRQIPARGSIRGRSRADGLRLAPPRPAHPFSSWYSQPRALTQSRCTVRSRDSECLRRSPPP